MKINVNEKGKAQCPGCGAWNELKIDHLGGLLHEFTCCRRNFLVSIDKEKLEQYMREAK